MTSDRAQLAEDIERLKVMLTTRATGGTVDHGDYPVLRAALMRDPLVKDKLPQFVRTCRSLDEFWNFIKPKVTTYRGRREFMREQFEPLLATLEETNSSPADGPASAVLGTVDSEHVRAAWQKALDRRTTDPEGAITAARTLLETVCKHVLDTVNENYDDAADLPKLYGSVAKALKLAPSQHTELIFKQILGGCHTVVEGLGALRNRVGDAHGRGKHAIQVTPRHAALAVNVAGSVATFLMETWEWRSSPHSRG